MASRTNAVVETQAPSTAPQDKRAATAKISPESAFGAAVKNRGALGAGGMLALQAAAGNRAVMGLVQARRERSSVEDSARVHEAAKLGIGGTTKLLPHLEKIQKSFGRHDVTGVEAHTGAQAAAGARAMGAAAFTMGNHVAFAGAPDLRTAAHEAAHVVQQRAGVQLQSGVGKVGDRYEREADRVAEAVVQGRSAEPILAHDPHAEQELGHEPTHVVQQRQGRVSATVVQRAPEDVSEAEVIKPGPPPTVKWNNWYMKLFNNEASATAMASDWDTAERNGVQTPVYGVKQVKYNGGTKWAFRSKAQAGKTFFQFSKGHAGRVVSWVNKQTNKRTLERARMTFAYVRQHIGDGQGFIDDRDGGDYRFIDINLNGTSPNAADVVTAIDDRLQALQGGE